MKTIFFFFFLMFQFNFSFCQVHVDDFKFNNSQIACFINETFVKSYIGFDLRDKEITYLSKGIPLEKPLIINGVKYTAKNILEIRRDIDYTTLYEIQKDSFPNIIEPVVFMIDHYFVMKDVNSYKLDKAYIAKCELVQSSSFEIFNNVALFNIIRIFTKRDQSARLR